MCIICDQYDQGEIDGKQALKKINDAIKVEMDPNQTGKLMKHMFDISEKILSREVPEPEINKEADEAFWNATHEDEE